MFGAMTNLSVQSVPLWLFFLLLALAGCGDEITKSNDRENATQPGAPRPEPSAPAPSAPVLAPAVPVPVPLAPLVPKLRPVTFLNFEFESYGTLRLRWEKEPNASRYELCYETQKKEYCPHTTLNNALNREISMTFKAIGALKFHDYDFYIKAFNGSGNVTKSADQKLMNYPQVLNRMIGYLKGDVIKSKVRFGTEVLFGPKTSDLFVIGQDRLSSFKKDSNDIWRISSFSSRVAQPIANFSKNVNFKSGTKKVSRLAISPNGKVIAVLADKNIVAFYQKNSKSGEWDLLFTENKLSEITSFSLSRDGRHALIGTSKGAYFVPIPQSSKNTTITVQFNDISGFVYDVAFIRGGFAIIHSDKGKIKLSLLVRPKDRPFEIPNQKLENYTGDASLDVSGDGKTLVIGLPDFDQKKGLVLVYKGSNIFGLKNSSPIELTPVTRGTQSMFGYSVAMNGDGSRILVGAPDEKSDHTGIYPDGGNAITSAVHILDSSGAAYLFEEENSGYKQADFIKSPSPRSKEHFGYSVTMDANGEFIAVGAPGESIGAVGFNQLSLDERKNSQTSSNSSEVGAVFLY